MTYRGSDIIIRTTHELVPCGGLSLRELSRLCDCHPSVVLRLYRLGMLDPISGSAEPLFSRAAVIRVRKALRLKRDLKLNFDAVAIVMELLDRIDELETLVQRHRSTESP